MNSAEYRQAVDAILKMASEKPIVQRNDPLYNHISKDDPLYEAAVGQLGIGTQDETERRVAAGIVGNALETHYGRGVISGFAADIGNSTRAVYDYMDMAALYDEDNRRAFSDKNQTIVYTHYRVAARLGKHLARHLQDIDAAQEAWDFLVECSNNAWSADQAEMEAKKRYIKPGDDDEGDEDDDGESLDVACRLTMVDTSVIGQAKLTFLMTEGMDIIDLLKGKVGDLFTFHLVQEGQAT